MRASWILTALLGCYLTGCADIFEAKPAATEQTAESDSITAANPGAGEQTQTQSPPQKPPTLKPLESGTQRVKAEAGVAAAGRSLDNETGVARVVVEPVKSLFAFKENAVFKIQIPQAMQLFKATEGNFPQSHEEFMTKIVRANKLRLPDLPAGHTYVYDPNRGELMVERPAK